MALWSHLTGEATDTDGPVVGFGRLSTASDRAMFEFRWPDCSPVPAYHRLPSLRGTGQRPSAVVCLSLRPRNALLGREGRPCSGTSRRTRRLGSIVQRVGLASGAGVVSGSQPPHGFREVALQPPHWHLA